MLKSYTFTYEMMDWGTQQQQQQGSTQNSTTTSPHHSPNNDHSDGKTYWNKKDCNYVMAKEVGVIRVLFNGKLLRT